MKLPVVSGKDVVKFLSNEGFEVVSRRGSHVRMKKRSPGSVLVTVVPLHKKLDIGTLHNILKQCNISKEKFLEHF